MLTSVPARLALLVLLGWFAFGGVSSAQSPPPEDPGAPENCQFDVTDPGYACNGPGVDCIAYAVFGFWPNHPSCQQVANGAKEDGEELADKTVQDLVDLVDSLPPTLEPYRQQILELASELAAEAQCAGGMDPPGHAPGAVCSAARATIAELLSQIAYNGIHCFGLSVDIASAGTSATGSGSAQCDREDLSSESVSISFSGAQQAAAADQTCQVTFAGTLSISGASISRTASVTIQLLTPSHDGTQGTGYIKLATGEQGQVSYTTTEGGRQQPPSCSTAGNWNVTGAFDELAQSTLDTPQDAPARTLEDSGSPEEGAPEAETGPTEETVDAADEPVESSYTGLVRPNTDDVYKYRDLRPYLEALPDSGAARNYPGTNNPDLTDAERKFCNENLSNFRLCVKAAAAAEEAEEQQDYRFSGANNKSKVDDYMGNAFKHCTWHGIMTMSMGQATAYGFGRRREMKKKKAGETKAHFRNAYIMDVFNNEAGIRIGIDVEDNTLGAADLDDKVGDRCEAGARNGSLYHLKPRPNFRTD